MDYDFSEAQKMLNNALKNFFNIRHPEKIAYIDKITLWLHKEKKADVKLVEEDDGISVKEPDGDKRLYFFKNPEIKMD